VDPDGREDRYSWLSFEIKIGPHSGSRSTALASVLGVNSLY
jgi:hypothetical protein